MNMKNDNSSRIDIAGKSSIISVASKISAFLISFISRKVFIDTIGVEYLGINQTLAQLISTLSVSELGIQTVIIFMLYKPVAQKDKNAIEDVLSAYRFLYRCIAGLIFVSSMLFIPFLDRIITNVSVNLQVVIVCWCIMSFTTAVSYLLSYNGALLFADLKQYKYIFIDTIIKTSIGLINLFLLFWVRNYIVYVAVTSLSNILSCASLLLLRKVLYPWIYFRRASRGIFRKVASSVKDLLWGRFCGYVFNSTDSILISAFVSTSSVAILGNYSTVFWGIYLVFTAVIEPIQALVGNFLVEADSHKTVQFLQRYSYINYLFGSVLYIPTSLLIEDFIAIFYGRSYVAERMIVILLLSDFFFIIMQTSFGMLLDASGKFKEQKAMYFWSAIINMGISLVGVHFFGIIGVLAGTAIGRLYLWVRRKQLAFQHVIKCSKCDQQAFLKADIKKMIVFIAIVALGLIINDRIGITESIFIFVIKGMLLEVAIVATHILAYRNTDEMQYVINYFKEKLFGTC